MLIFQIEYRARQEALRLKELEAKQLEKQFGKKKAREVAEMKFQERIDDFERKEYEEEVEHKEMAKRNRQR
jgi:hypothetical protein